MGQLPTPKAKPAFDASKYAYVGAYDHVKVVAGFKKAFSGGEFAQTTPDDLLTFLAFIEADAGIADLRWAAYMLATVHKEAKTLVEERIVFDKKGKLLTDKKGNPTPRIVHKWQLMHPVEEDGHGANKGYYEPVKTALQTDGTILVTEHDGDQFIVNVIGTIRDYDPTARGAIFNGKAAATYIKASGQENSYFGRGYVQLTWWDGYLRAGKELGMGTELLTNPTRVQEPSLAYRIMSYGMINGKIFANGLKFSDYFTSTSTNYKGARAMVNGTNKAQEIAGIAELYEAILLDSRISVNPAPTGVSPLATPTFSGLR